jgi:hypothetical protein
VISSFNQCHCAQVSVVPTDLAPEPTSPCIVFSLSHDGQSPQTFSLLLTLIGLALTVASVVLALLQYRLQLRRPRDPERDTYSIPISPPFPLTYLSSIPE